MKMELSVQEAALLLGRSPRTLRGQLVRGELHGVKKNGAWRIPRDHLPLTEGQRRTLLERADEARRVVEEALPSRLATHPGKTAKSLLDLDSFRIGRDLLFAIRKNPDERDESIETLLEEALLVVARGKFAFEIEAKVRVLRDARDRFSVCLAQVLISADPLVDPRLGWAVRLERELLPSVCGLLRWAENRQRGNRR